MRILTTLAAAVAMTVLAGAGRAQCTPIPNTGCPGAMPPQCGANPSIGGTLMLSCLNNGRTNVSFMLIGNVAVGILPIGGVTCLGQVCGIGVDLAGVVTLQPNFQLVSFPIPNNPTLIGQSIAAQCIDVLPAPNQCVLISQALQITFMP